MININKLDLTKNPFWHIKKKEIIDNQLFQSLKKDFPDDDLYNNNNLRKISVRAGDDLYPCDKNYEKLLNRSESWMQLVDYLNSKDFLNNVFNIFHDNLVSENLNVNLYKYVLEKSYTPSRFERANSQKNLIIKKIMNKFYNQKNNLYVTCDISRAKMGYSLQPHCDHQYRLFSFIIYFTNPKDIGMKGGNLEIYKRKNLNLKSRNLDSSKLELIESITPQENLGIIFPSHSYSYHSVSPISEIKGYRKFLYIGISSKSNFIWN